MKEVLASYRWRRRLIWLTATVAFVAGAVVVGVRWSNTAPHEAVAPSGGPLKVDYSPPKKVRLTLRDKSAALAVASRFIDTAVARKDVDRAWGLEPNSRLSCQAILDHKDLVVEIPKYSINHAKENH